DKREADLEALTNVKVGHIEIKPYEKYNAILELMIDRCDNEMDIFSFPFADENSIHDEEIEGRIFEAFEDESLFDEGLLECIDYLDGE
ncbi:hypothetical protein KI387_005098, partial [Taxus chinensis]